MGTSLVLGSSFCVRQVSLSWAGPSAARRRKITSALASMEVRTISANVVRATMMFTPMMPCVASRAFSISRRRARRLASRGLLATSGSFIPIMAPAMTPMPPSLATAEASLERNTACHAALDDQGLALVAYVQSGKRHEEPLGSLMELWSTQAGIGMPPGYYARIYCWEDMIHTFRQEHQRQCAPSRGRNSGQSSICRRMNPMRRGMSDNARSRSSMVMPFPKRGRSPPSSPGRRTPRVEHGLPVACPYK